MIKRYCKECRKEVWPEAYNNTMEMCQACAGKREEIENEHD